VYSCENPAGTKDNAENISVRLACGNALLAVVLEIVD